ncbi:MAG: chemotaxis protein CheX [Pseudomonadota bacterium]|nr:chemotaxis protein CheX [Pseudomonadota bacterium]
MLPIAPVQNAITLSADALFELAESIWHSLLEMEVQRIDHWSADLPEDGMLTGCVYLDGDWRGSVTLICPKPLARQTAAAMFKATPAAMTETEVQDAIGELTHMLGGNLKSLLPTPCHLSPPAVVEGYTIPKKGRIVEQILLRCENQPLQIILFEREKLL